ncbi:ArsR/SmtB family transcription factor [Desmospora activa]|uniref:Putative transcriptional regulator n=1 Tax=Desmospora activa DSM 45169 TaxID=1121389 RepID=A0A2T4Z7G7_9BACL|nr:helix-turn-helix domain-containing protein [Desmospora activa]PTM57838.1 putative transcriptional regulator [Desmospora activa DSM 45169]
MVRELKLELEEMEAIAKALSNKVRIDIFRALQKQPMNVNEISQRFNMPASSATVNIRKLEEAGLIRTELLPGSRGSQKVCSAIYDRIVIDMEGGQKEEDNSVSISMPIGNFVDCEVSPTCGLLSEDGIIGLLDDPASFYEPERTQAQLLWFRKGYVEYRFPNKTPSDSVVQSLELTMEVCSEAPLHQEQWPSDLSLWVNGVEVGTWLSPGDFGGERGMLTPEWWDTDSTQFGLLKKWRINGKGSYIDGEPLSPITINELNLYEKSYLTVRLGVKDEADNIGGINLFGRRFGNYELDLLLRIHYQRK